MYRRYDALFFQYCRRTHERENAKIFLKENPEIREGIRKTIIDFKYSNGIKTNTDIDIDTDNSIDNDSENQ